MRPTLGGTQALTELEPLRGTALYAAARRQVLGVYNMQGAEAALLKARQIREAFEDMKLSEKVAA